MNGKRKAVVWYSQGNPNGNRVAKGMTYRESSVMCPKGKKKQKGVVSPQQ